MFLLVLISACGDHGASITTKDINAGSGIPINQAITSALPSDGTLSAYLRIDNGERQPMTISGNFASITLTDVSVGAHIITIEFEYVFPEASTKPTTPLMLASSSQAMNIVGGDNTLDFANADYDTDGYDDDHDGVSNLQELADNTNPFAGVVVSDISNSTGEDGTQATFTVVLSSRPTADVTIDLSSSDTSEGIIDRATLTFIPSEWDTAQTVTVTGVEDSVIDGNVTYTIVTAPVSSDDPNYGGLDPTDTSVVNIDNDTPSFIESPILNHTSENGASVTFSVTLSSQPTDNVNVAVHSSDVNEGVVSPALLTFTTDNWNIATDHSVTVTGVNDHLIDGAQTYQVVLDPATSQDTNYDGLDPADLSVTNDDNDIPGVSIGTLSGNGHTTESGGTVTFDLTLNTQPLDTVTINLTSSNTNEGTVNPASVIFQTTDWNRVQTVTVTGVDESVPVADGPQTYTITLSKPDSSDTNYSQLTPNDVAVINDDNESTPSISLSFDQASIAEASGTAMLTAVTDVLSTSDIVVGLGYSLGEANVSQDFSADSSITIPANSSSSSIPITGIQDSLDERDESITANIISVTNGQAAATNTASTTIIDDDSPPTVSLELDNTSPLAEIGGSTNLIATLSAQSGLPVTVNLVYSGTATVDVDYSKSDTITIAAGELSSQIAITTTDDTRVEGDETIIISIDNNSLVNASAGSPDSVATTITDDDQPVANFSGSAHSVTEGLGNGSVSVSSSVVAVSVTLDQPGVVDTSIPYTVGGSATQGAVETAGADYDLSNGTLTIPAGSSSADITFNVFNDSIDEQDETVDITLGTPVNATLGTGTNYTVTIVNNSAPTVSNITITDTDGNDPAVSGDVLSGSYTYADEEGDAESTSGSLYQWIREGYAIKGATAASYTLTNADAGAQITLQVTPVAGTGTRVGTPVSSSATAVDHAPRATHVGITTTSTLPLAATDVLTGVYTYTDVEGDGENTDSATGTKFRWLKNGHPIPGQTSTTYTLTASDIDQAIQFDVTPVALSGSITGKHIVSPAGVNVARVGEMVGGLPRKVVVKDDYAYVAAGGVLSIVDISNPAKPTQVSYYESNPSGSVVGIAVSGNYAYLADSTAGLQILDISDPTLPKLMSSISPLDAYDVAIYGNYAFVAGGSWGLNIYDVSVPTAPQFLWKVTIANANSVAISGNYAYVTDQSVGLQVLDISDLAVQPVITETISVDPNLTNEQFYDVAIGTDGRYAYIAADSYGVQVVDISTPGIWTPVVLYKDGYFSRNISIQGNYAYVADIVGLLVLDLSAPDSPQTAGYFNSGQGASSGGVAASGNFAYLADAFKGLLSIDISDKSHLKEIGAYYVPSDPHGVAINGSYAYVADSPYRLAVLDVTDPTLPTVATSMYVRSGISGIATSGNYVYMNASGLTILDITTPTNPILNSFTSTNGGGQGVAISGEYAYLTDGPGGLRVFNISNPLLPFEGTAAVATGDYALDVVINGSYAYVADNARGMRIFDINTDPAIPNDIGYDNTLLTTAQQVAINGRYAYVANNSGGIRIIDLVDSTNPTPTDIGAYTDPGGGAIKSVAIGGGNLYYSEGSVGLHILDITNDPTLQVSPSTDEIGYVHTPGTANKIDIDGNNVYLSDGGAGVEIYEYKMP
ncbi:MAG: Calx-beta domain-containing protein [Gammaproteobacteria bacterium]